MFASFKNINSDELFADTYNLKLKYIKNILLVNDILKQIRKLLIFGYNLYLCAQIKV